MKITIFPQRKIFFLTLLTLLVTNTSAQVDWTKYGNNPIMNLGSPGSWESVMSGITSIIFRNGQYEAWLFGLDETNTGKIGYATSVDGISWVKYADNPVLGPGNPGDWDGVNSDHACVLFVDGMYKMWYMGEDGSSSRIGYATSTDGINWFKYSLNPVVNLGPPGAWDENEVMHPCVYYDGDIYHMWYNGYGQNLQRTGYATSPDGIVWTKYAGNPVLNLGTPGTWDDYMLVMMSVLFRDGEFKMWYTAGDGTEESSKYFRVGYATSPEGVNWTKHANNPVLDKGSEGQWDSIGVVTSSVLFDENENIYKMWYGGLDGISGKCGLAFTDPVTYITESNASAMPGKYNLSQNYPNPFNSSAVIEYNIGEAGFVTIAVFDVLGNKLMNLEKKYLAAGHYKLNLDGNKFSSGVYFYRMFINDFTATKKFTLLK